MREGWEYRKLGEVCEILDSKRKPITKSKREAGDIPYYGATGLLDYVKEYIFDEKLLLLGEDGAKWGAGEDSAYIVEGKTWVNNHAHVLKPIEVSYEFLVYFLKYSDLSPFITGVTVPKLNQEKMRSIEVCLPNKISEQQRIVAYLDSSFAKIDEMKANAAKALSEAKALFQAELKKCMEKKDGWEEKTLDSFAEIQSGYAFRSSEFQSSGRYQIIRMGNVRPGTLRLKENAVFLDSVEDDNVLSKALLKKGDIVITQTGTRNKRDYGFTTIIDKDNLLLNQRIARIRVVDTLDNKYLLYYTWADRFRDQFFANEGGTVGQGNVGMDAIRGNIIHFPPLEIQHSIVTHLDTLSQKVQELERNYNTILAECDALKQAILRETFE